MIDSRELRHRSDVTNEQRWLDPVTTKGRPEDHEPDAAASGGGPVVSPAETLTRRYIERAMLRAATKQYAEDGTWFAEITVLADVWGDGATEEDALVTLEDVLKNWIELKLHERDGDIPVVDGINLNVLS